MPNYNRIKHYVNNDKDVFIFTWADDAPEGVKKVIRFEVPLDKDFYVYDEPVEILWEILDYLERYRIKSYSRWAERAYDYLEANEKRDKIGWLKDEISYKERELHGLLKELNELENTP